MSARLASLFQSTRTALRLLVEGELREIARRGYRLIGTRVAVAPATLAPIDQYEAWLSVNRWTLKARRHLINRLAEHEWADLKFTVLVSVEPGDLAGLAHTLDSLDQQVYENWEALIVTRDATAAYAERMVGLIPGGRTRVVAVQAPHEALGLATGRFVLRLCPGDRLGPDALAEFALELADFPGTDLIFCDDDEGRVDGSRLAPRFKPDWSPESYATLNFPRQAVLVRRTALDRHSAMSLFAADPLHEIVGSDASGEPRVRHLQLVLHHRSADSGDGTDTGTLLARYDRSLPLNPNLARTGNGVAIVPRRVVRGAVPPIRAMMFTPNLNREGAPYSQFELTRALRDRGVIDPQVISFHDGPLHELYRSAGIPVHVHDPILTEIPTLRRYERVIARLARFIRHRRPGVVYANTLLNFPAIEAANREGMPSIWNPRESEPWQSAFGYLSESVARRALSCFPLPYRVVFVAHATENAWARFNVAHNAAVIHNGLDMRRFAPSQAPAARTHARQSLGVGDGELMVLLLGTVCERKGQRDLAAAIARLDPSLVARAWFFIVGDEPGSYSDELKRDIAKLPPRSRGSGEGGPHDQRRRLVLPRCRRLCAHLAVRELPARDPRGDGARAADRDHPVLRGDGTGSGGAQRVVLHAGDANRLAVTLSEPMKDDGVARGDERCVDRQDGRDGDVRRNGGRVRRDPQRGVPEPMTSSGSTRSRSTIGLRPALVTGHVGSIGSFSR